MIKIDDKNKCCGCHGCMNICAKNAITMIVDEKGFKYPKIDNSKCINCNLCEKVCPIINKKDNINSPTAYAAYNKDEKIRLESSSGGIFSLVANYILENDGIIFGAAFNDDFQVSHIEVNNKDELYKLRTSKYVQSSINDTYKKAKEYLNKGTVVLFTGTPCQIEGLYAFLQKKYVNLYTQDIICHGVPSPKVWQKYMEYRKKQDKNDPVRINFRQKDDGWNLYALLLQYNNSAYKTNHNDDLFMQAFLKNVCLRDSCYNCAFKDKHRKSDITLADFWGINNIDETMNDDKGTSLVIINSDKGKELFNKIKDKIVSKKVDFEKSIQYNQSMYKSVDIPKTRESFFENLDNLEFDELVKKYTPRRNFVKMILGKVKRIIKSNIISKINK